MASGGLRGELCPPNVRGLLKRLLDREPTPTDPHSLFTDWLGLNAGKTRLDHLAGQLEPLAIEGERDYRHDPNLEQARLGNACFALVRSPKLSCPPRPTLVRSTLNHRRAKHASRPSCGARRSTVVRSTQIDRRAEHADRPSCGARRSTVVRRIDVVGGHYRRVVLQWLHVHRSSTDGLRFG